MLATVRQSRCLTQRPAALAALLMSVCVASGALVFWTESMAYGNLPSERLDQLVGVKGECCTPGLKTECGSVAPFACTTSGVVCDGQSSFDSCGGPSCGESESSDDGCDSQGFETISVTVGTCDVIPGGQVYCEGGAKRCMYTSGTATVDFTGCGQNSICPANPGVTCQ